MQLQPRGFPPSTLKLPQTTDAWVHFESMTEPAKAIASYYPKMQRWRFCGALWYGMLYLDHSLKALNKAILLHPPWRPLTRKGGGLQCSLQQDGCVVTGSSAGLLSLALFKVQECSLRMCLAIRLILAKSGTYVLEQPVSSIIWRHPRMQQLLQVTRATRTSRPLKPDLSCLPLPCHSLGCCSGWVEEACLGLPKLRHLATFPIRQGIPCRLLDVPFRREKCQKDQTLVQFQGDCGFL